MATEHINDLVRQGMNGLNNTSSELTLNGYCVNLTVFNGLATATTSSGLIVKNYAIHSFYVVLTGNTKNVKVFLEHNLNPSISGDWFELKNFTGNVNSINYFYSYSGLLGAVRVRITGTNTGNVLVSSLHSIF